MVMVRFHHACLHDSDADLNAVQVSRGEAWNPALAAQQGGLVDLASSSQVAAILLVMALTLAELHVCVLTSFIKLIKRLQNLMKILTNHIMV